MRKLRIGSRGSRLALWQANHIGAELARLHNAEWEIVIVKTSGDRFQQSAPAQVGLKGIFTKELEEALLDGRIDLAVHSMKDVPTEIPAGLGFPAVTKREDVRDALLSRTGAKLSELPPGARIGTGSLRRRAQLLRARPNLAILEVRGNVDTRIRKMEQGDFDAVVLAKAGLDRLGFSAKITEVLSCDVSLPAVGQGALGIESRADDAEVVGLLRALNHTETRAGVMAERALLRELEGGCQLPLGAWGRLANSQLVLEARVLSANGQESIGGRIAGRPEDAEKLGRELGRKMLAAGADRLLKLAGRNVGTNSKMPLMGRRMVITRAREQAGSLAEPLERLGAEILYFPAVAFSAPQDTIALDAAIAALDQFDWLVLTSQNAVRFFCQRCRELGTAAARERLQVAAVGPATADVAQAEGLSVNFVARRHSGAALADELGAAVRGKRVLLPRSDRAGEDLPAKLRAAGAEVTDVVAYCTGAPEPADAKIIATIRDGRADVIVFASPSAVHHFVEQLGWPAMAALGHKTMLAAIGPTTAKAIREAGLRVGIEAAESSAQGLVTAIEEFFRKESSSEVQRQ